MTTTPPTSQPASAGLEAGRRLYAALSAGDVATLTELLADGFQGHLSAGLPHGFGATVYDGREAMMRDGWGAVGKYFTMAPHVEELLEAGPYVIGRGNYIGAANESGRPVKAAFAHFWAFDGERFTSVRQVTDSAVWHEALQR